MTRIKGGWGGGAILYLFREAGRGGLSGRTWFESGLGVGGELSVYSPGSALCAGCNFGIRSTHVVTADSPQQRGKDLPVVPPNKSAGWRVTVKMGGDHNFSSQSERISIPPTPLPSTTSPGLAVTS